MIVTKMGYRQILKRFSLTIMPVALLSPFDFANLANALYFAPDGIEFWALLIALLSALYVLQIYVCHPALSK